MVVLASITFAYTESVAAVIVLVIILAELLLQYNFPPMLALLAISCYQSLPGTRLLFNIEHRNVITQYEYIVIAGDSIALFHSGFNSR